MLPINEINCYFEIDDRINSEEIQKILFKLGYRWSPHKDEENPVTMHSSSPYLFTECSSKSILLGLTLILRLRLTSKK